MRVLLFEFVRMLRRYFLEPFCHLDVCQRDFLEASTLLKHPRTHKISIFEDNVCFLKILLEMLAFKNTVLCGILV